MPCACRIRIFDTCRPGPIILAWQHELPRQESITGQSSRPIAGRHGIFLQCVRCNMRELLDVYPCQLRENSPDRCRTATASRRRVPKRVLESTYPAQDPGLTLWAPRRSISPLSDCKACLSIETSTAFFSGVSAGTIVVNRTQPPVTLI